MNRPDDHEDHETLRDEAVAWFVRLDSKTMTADEWRTFEAWRRQNPAHQRAFGEIEQLWGAFDRLPEKPRVSLPSAALLPSARSASRPAAAVHGLHRRLALGITTLVACLLLAWAFDLSTRLRADHRTDIGDSRTIALADGSSVRLNTDSAIAVDLSPARRRVTLLRGEALFAVAPEPERPFEVVASHGTSTALGTEFIVRWKFDAVVVTVLEGHVAVAFPDTGGSSQPPPTVTLSRGQQVTYDRAGGLGQAEPVDLPTATAWLRGKIIFQARPLGDVIDELNRYHVGHIRIIDARVRDLRVNGVFETAAPQRVVTALEQALPVRVTRLTDRLILLHR